MIPAAIALTTVAVIVGNRRAASACASPAYCSSRGRGDAPLVGAEPCMTESTEASTMMEECVYGGDCSEYVTKEVEERCTTNLSIPAVPEEAVRGADGCVSSTELVKLVL